MATPCASPVGNAPRPSVLPPVAAFLGDSYTTGYVGAGIGSAGWPAMVSTAFGWHEVMKAVAGTGFVNPGWTAQPIGTQVAAVVRARPGIVFIVGGHNDDRYSTVVTAAAADAVLDHLRADLPHAVLVVIGPIWPTGTPPSTMRVLRDHLARKAAAIGATFIDPIGGGWFAGASRSLIGLDGIHPTQAGERHIAAMILPKLRVDPRIVAPHAPSTCGA